MDIQKHIDKMFADYQENPALADFKEELTIHIDERIKGLVKKGMDEKSAFEKAINELGDVSVIADEIGKKKRQDVFSEMYMKTRNYITPVKGALYVLCGLVLGLAVILPLLTWYASGMVTGTVMVLLPFGMAAVLGFLFLGLMQETATREAMSWKRAIWYVLAAGLILFGVLVAFVTYFGMESVGPSNSADVIDTYVYTLYGNKMFKQGSTSVVGAITVLMIFSLPGIALGIFLILTEKDRSKSWVIRQREEQMKYADEHFSRK